MVILGYMKLQEQINRLGLGETFITGKSTAAVYKAAKSAGCEVTVHRLGDSSLQVCLAKAKLPEMTLMERFWVASIDERLEIIDSVEVCCGMRKGQCICPREIKLPIPHVNVPRTGNDVMDFIAKAQAKKGIEVGLGMPMVDDENPVEETWRFKDISVVNPLEFHENGNVYRMQWLAPLGKRTRRVQVDADNPDEIIKVV